MLESLGVCPLCSSELLVGEYTCTGCGTTLKGSFRMCDLCNLTAEQQHFIRIFLKCQGNIKEVEKMLGLSYPTVKARLAAVNQKLALEDFSEYMETQNRLTVLRDFKEGKLNLDEALKRI